MKQKVLIVIFLLMTAVPALLFLFTFQSATLNENEKREIAPFPVFSMETLDSYPGKFEEYFNDRLPLRKELINMNAAINYEVFQTISSEKVSAGKDGWLYYNADDGKKPLESYANGSEFTEQELQTIAGNLMKMKEICEQQGVPFTFMMIPNKEEVYSQYIPDEYQKISDKRQYDQLLTYLKENTDIHIVDAEQDIVAYKERYQLYNKLDTHWNELGAFVGAQVLLKEMDGHDAVDLADYTISSLGKRSGDLAGMAGLENILKDDDIYNVDGYLDGIIPEVADGDGQARTYMVSNNENGGSLLMYEDSFGTWLLAPLSKNFEKSCFIWNNMMENPQDYPLTEDIAETGATEVVLEKVERFLPQLLDMNIY